MNKGIGDLNDCECSVLTQSSENVEKRGKYSGDISIGVRFRIPSAALLLGCFDRGFTSKPVLFSYFEKKKGKQLG
jgi:hypothetical protein